jgi:hypothetical protein
MAVVLKNEALFCKCYKMFVRCSSSSVYCVLTLQEIWLILARFSDFSMSIQLQNCVLQARTLIYLRFKARLLQSARFLWLTYSTISGVGSICSEPTLRGYVILLAGRHTFSMPHSLPFPPIVTSPTEVV